MPPWLRGHGGYALGALASIPGLAMPEVEVTDGALPLWSGRAAAVVFANTPVFGHGMRVAPHARHDDGLLDVCIVGALSRLRLAALLPTVFLGRHLGIPGVHYFQTATLGLQSATPLDLFADGEFIAPTPARITVLPAALQVIA